MTDSKKNSEEIQGVDGEHPLHPAPLAYLNPDYLNSPDGRILRILAEYSEAFPLSPGENPGHGGLFWIGALRQPVTERKSADDPGETGVRQAGQAGITTGRKRRRRVAGGAQARTRSG